MAWALWTRIGERGIRFMSIALSELAPASVNQLDLFEQPEQRSERVSALVDQLRDRFGEAVVLPARLLHREELAPERIAFGKLPPRAQDRH